MRQCVHGISREGTEDSQGVQVQHDTASKATGLCCKAIAFMFASNCALNLLDVFVSLLSSHTGTCCASQDAVTDL